MIVARKRHPGCEAGGDEPIQGKVAPGEERLRTLFETMGEGFALHEIICDADGRPVDYRFREVNPAFERQTGLRGADIVGRTVREVLPGIEPVWIERYGRVALGGGPESFEARSETLGRWYEVRAYQTAPGRFAVLFMDVTERKHLQQELEQVNQRLEQQVAERTRQLSRRTRQLQRLALQLSEAEERERRRIAEVLHDDLQQQLAGARYQADLLARLAATGGPEGEAATRLQGMLTQAIATARSLSHEMSPAVVYRDGLGAALVQLARHKKERYGLEVRLDLQGELDDVPEPVALFLYKSAQEILFNVVKYAGVTEARLRLRRRGDRLWLLLGDHGRGFDPEEAAASRGTGLLGIRERAEALDGRLEARSAPGRGARFLLVVPLRPRPEFPTEPPA